MPSSSISALRRATAVKQHLCLQTIRNGRENLSSRHILEPAIAAGAWIECSDYYERNCLVWHEKRRDGSRGARRRRFIDPPVIEGRQYGKTIWFDGEKTDEPFHYVGTLDELKARDRRRRR